MIGSATLEAMIQAGLEPAQMLAIVRAMEADAKPKDRTAAERQRRHRANKASANDTRDMSQRDVTRDPPNDIYSNPPLPSAKADGAADETEVSPEANLWASGKAMLGKLGVPKSQAGSIIGKWKKTHGVGETIEALAAADRESRMNGGLVDPIGFVEGVFRHRHRSEERPIC